MKRYFLAGILIGILPTMALAGGRYDRGDRYYGHGHSNSFFGISLGFGGDDWFGGFSYSSGGYYPRYASPRYYPAYRPYRYYAPTYVAPPPAVIYPAPVYAAPVYRAPVVVYPRSYYYSPRSHYYAPSKRYYYGR